MWLEGNNSKLMESLDEIVDSSHKIPVKRVQMWSKCGESEFSLYEWRSTVRDADSLASVLMDSSLYGWTIDCIKINPDDCYEVEFFISQRSGKYSTNITPEVVENLMGLTWGIE